MSGFGRVARWGKALRAVSRDPEGDWPDRIMHHGLRGIVVLGLAVAIPLLYPLSPLPRFAYVEEGVVASEDIIADVGFPVMKSPERLERERREAVRGVTPIFTYEPTRADSSIRALGHLFDALEGTADDTTAVRWALRDFGVAATSDQAAFLTDPQDRERLRRALEEAYRELLVPGVAPGAHLEEAGARRMVVRGPAGDRLVQRDSIVTAGAFFETAAERVPGDLSAPGLQLYQTLLVRFWRPTLRFDRDATEAARQQARDAVEPTEGYILQGERIIQAHERVGAAEIEKLSSYQAELERRGITDGEGEGLRMVGASLHGLLVLGLLGAILFLLRPSVYRDMKSFSLILGSVFLVVAASSLFTGVDARAALVPVAFAALLVGALYDSLLGVIVAVAVATLLAVQPPFAGATTPYLTILAGSAAALGVTRVRERADSWILIAVVGGAYVAGAASLTLMRTLPLEDFLWLSLWGGMNAAACTVFAIGAAVPAMERFTDITTDQTLLELSDLNRPLLRRLSREAPGTYAHSINVANLAEAACDAVGANALLARAGAYYHDIGKMNRPQFFIENQPPGRNPHDRISPERSVEVIREHVEEGVRLAREARLPGVIRDFVREHHGTAPISFFWEKECRRMGVEAHSVPSDFRYDGPRPRSQETAIVMLADGVESACRMLPDPTPQRIRELVEGITEARLRDGQLEEAPLTLRDLRIVKEELVRILSGMYHRRVDYPGAEDEEQQGESGARG